MKIAISTLLIFLYLTSLEILISQPKIDYWEIILICVQFLCSSLAIFHFLKPSKKRALKQGRVRLQRHIDERKALIEKIKKQHQVRPKSKIIYGYPWWPWFK
ncbi:hypothetical protein [Acinetobacter sp.]|uniref:hypothetical protein n=1 Tax=Acinetobacter sp. TaxID=472 RepID=UPI0028AE3126|nr:hypothetical protein [Acinetobacter sp.]